MSISLSGSFRILRLSIPVLLIALSGCSRKDASGSFSRTVTDSDGIEVVENGSVPRQWDGTLPRLRLEQLASVGAADGPDEQLISNAGRYIRVSAGPNGQVGYIERQPAELRVYDGDGTFLWRAGRSGEGPGEWRNASYLTYMNGTGWVLTTFPYRVVVFDENGTLKESRPAHDIPGMRMSIGRVLHPSGLMWSWTQDAMNNIESFGHVFRGDWRTLTSTKIDSMLHSTLHIEGTDSAYLQSFPFAMDVDPEGRLWLYASLDYQLDVYEPEGDGRWRVRREFELVPYSQAERREAETTWSAMISGRNIYGRLNENHSPIRGLKWVNRNELWVFTSTYVDSPVVQVDVFDAAGVYQRAFAAELALSWANYQESTVWQLKENDEGIPQLVRSRYWLDK